MTCVTPMPPTRAHQALLERKRPIRELRLRVAEGLEDDDLDELIGWRLELAAPASALIASFHEMLVICLHRRQWLEADPITRRLIESGIRPPLPELEHATIPGLS